MDSYVDGLMEAGGSFITLAKGNRSKVRWPKTVLLFLLMSSWLAFGLFFSTNALNRSHKASRVLLLLCINLCLKAQCCADDNGRASYAIHLIVVFQGL